MDILKHVPSYCFTDIIKIMEKSSLPDKISLSAKMILRFPDSSFFQKSPPILHVGHLFKVRGWPLFIEKPLSLVRINQCVSFSFLSLRRLGYSFYDNDRKTQYKAGKVLFLTTVLNMTKFAIQINCWIKPVG